MTINIPEIFVDPLLIILKNLHQSYFGSKVTNYFKKISSLNSFIRCPCCPKYTEHPRGILVIIGDKKAILLLGSSSVQKNEANREKFSLRISNLLWNLPSFPLVLGCPECSSRLGKSIRTGKF